MRVEDVLKIIDQASRVSKIWIDGGWCVDALVGRVTRSHSDLDIAVSKTENIFFRSAMEEIGFRDLKSLDTSEWNYVLVDSNDLKIDVHVFEYDSTGKNVYGVAYPIGSLSGSGLLLGRKVNCVSAEWIFKFKTSYQPRSIDLQDIEVLSENFGFDIPPSHRSEITPILSSKIEHDLLALGVKPNSILMVHASMRKIGPVIGGAETVLESLLKALTPTGTLLMVLSADTDEPFDYLKTPVDIEDMGILAEVFRKHPNTKVNDHAADRFAAIGSKADYLLNPTPLHDYHGPGSVLERLVRSDGSVLRLGANVDTVTLTHYAEYLANIPNKRRVKRRYIRADVGEQWIESLDDSDGIAEWTGGDYFPQILVDFIAAGNANVGAVGNCFAELFDARLFVDFAVVWMEKNL